MKHIFTLSISLCFFLASFSQAGTLDKSFNGTGKKIIAFSYGGVAGEDDCYDMAIQSDGKPVLVGWSNATQGGDYNFVVTRLNTDGSLDQSFNGKGYIFINFLGDDKAVAVAIQSDGKIVVAGTANYNGVAKIAVAQLLTNGLPDPSFGTNLSGKVITGFSADAFANCMTIQGDGKILVGCGYNYNGNYECLLLRYNTNGTLDQSFGALGRSFTDFGSEETAKSVAVQAGGKIVVGAASSYSPPLIARFNSNGSLDGGFGNNGKRAISLLTCAAIAIQGNGKIVVTGSYQGSQSSDFAVARYNINGAIDTTFSGDGKAITNIGGSTSSDDYPHDVAIQGDGKIVVAGTTFRSVASGNENFGLVRYNKNGTLDNTFGDHGKVTTDFGNSQNGNYESAYAVKIQSNGKIVAAGTRDENLSGNFAVARYHGDNAAPQISAGEANENTTAEKLSSIHIYPNPVTSVLRVEGLNTFSPATISITDLRGIVFQKTTVTTNEYKFDVSALKPGVYNVTIFENGKVITLKFIKQ